MITRSSRSAHVCLRCQLTQHRRLYSTGSSQAPPSPPPSGAAKLTNRRIISLIGHETPKFLQGIITNNVRADSANGFYAAFLTAQGKVLHDTFVYPTRGSKWSKEQAENDEEPGYLVEVDADQAEVLLKHLKRHKLRSKFKLRLVEDGELNVWSLWKEGERWTAHGQPHGNAASSNTIALTDCRAPGMGQRLVLSETDAQAALEGVEEAPLSAYTIRRYLRGVAEGQKEMPRDDCLPMNCNIDLMGGIDFKKGCYVGQELTIRTHHTGVVRRRILPVSLFERESEAPTRLEYNPTSHLHMDGREGVDVRRDDHRKRSTGKFLAGIGNIGLATCRLEQMTDLKISGEPSSYKPEDSFVVEAAEGKELGLKAFVPDWVRGNIREPKIQKRV